MSAFYGLPARTSRGNDARQGTADATLAAVCGLGLLLTACGGLFDGGDPKAGLSCLDDSPECVEQRQMTLKAMLADKDRAWVREAAIFAGARLRRSAVRVPRAQEGAELRGAGARPARGRRRRQEPARARRPGALTGADLARLNVRCRGLQGTHHRDARPPLQGVSRSAVRVRDRPPAAGARAAPTPADDRSRPRVPCRRPTR